MSESPILAFDCSTQAAGVALLAHGRTEERAIAQGRQAAELVDAIDALMRGANVAYGELGAIVTTLGPGSFTGLRIALATLHGLVLAVPRPVKTLTSTEAVAWDIARWADSPEHFAIAMNAGKGEIFWQSFTNDANRPRAQGDIELGSPEALAGLTVPFYGNTLDPADAHYIAGPSAAVLCAIAAELPESPLSQAQPLYIRPPDAKIPEQPAWLA
ncbi:MAG: tRNA (adenosine(37)-N6)-threonylcarbamoyltransferase complex dimerization subunit type 1 TsaB [Alphaproteobacteria bacterium]